MHLFYWPVKVYVDTGVSLSLTTGLFVDVEYEATNSSASTVEHRPDSERWLFLLSVIELPLFGSTLHNSTVPFTVVLHILTALQ